MKSPYPDSKATAIPVDANGLSIDDDLLADLVILALGAPPALTPAWVLATVRAFNEERNYESALAMAATALRFAQENKPK